MTRSVQSERKFKSEAVILAGLGANGYGTLRNLGREGVPVVGIADQAGDPGRFSRYCSRYYIYNTNLVYDHGYFYSSLLSDYEALTQKLLQWRADFKHDPVLFATGDPFAFLLAKFKEELSPHYLYHWVSMETFSRILNKDQMSLLCQQAGILIPRTHITDSQEDLQASARNFSFPCLVKPIQRAIPGFPLDRKNFVASSPRELMDFYGRYPGLRGTTIWQEIIEGGDENNFVCALLVRKSGDPAGVFCTRKLHQYPAYGVMSYGRSEQNDDVVSEALKLVRLLGYRGIASLEFKYRPRDGRYYFIEMNPRCPRYNGYFAKAGVNLQLLTYLDLTGTTDDRAFAARQRNGTYWVCALDEGKRCWKTRAGRWPNLWQWFKSVVRSDCYAFWDWRDPKPFVVSSFQTLSAGIRKLLRMLPDAILGNRADT